ncbi:MAG: cysteine desulfurase [Chloroflexi bacterium]|nr:MAG: cysteine desulfurase [Chloroflexota bacterium]
MTTEVRFALGAKQDRRPGFSRENPDESRPPARFVPSTRLDPLALRADFPILAREVHGKPLAYLDNAASTQKPQAVIETLSEFYRTHYANIHRGVHTLSEEATLAYEEARDKVAAFINAPDRSGVIFVRNATEAINLVAYTWGRASVGPGDRVVVTEMEHHSNLVPWQLLTQEVGAELTHVRVTDEGRLDLESLDHLLQGPVKLVAFTHVSNVLGTVNPAREIVARAHAAGARVLVDAAQSVPHLPMDVEALDCDFLAFSGHKMCGPTGVGVLYGRPELLEEMPPFLTGGGMIRRVTRTEATWNDLPWKFEAGTSAIAEAVGLGVAVDYLSAVGMEAVWAHERELTAYALECLAEMPEVRVIGPPAGERSGVVAFTVEGIHPHDLAQVLDGEGVAIRAGHHCAQPLHARFGLEATARASFYLYNAREEVDRLVEGIKKAQDLFIRRPGG